MSAKYACMARHRTEFAVVLMCRVLAVSPSGFSAAHQRALSAHARRDEQLRVLIRTAHQRSRRRYGAPRVHNELAVVHGERVAKKRVARLMRSDGLYARRPRRFVPTTDTVHADPIAPNTLDRQCAVGTNAVCDRVWASDLTYIPTRAGRLSLAVVLDLASRRVVGWALRPTLERDLVLAALTMALTHRQPAWGVLHHSDSGESVRLARLPGAVDGTRPGGEHEPARELLGHAVTESFFATLKTELVYECDWTTREEARRDLFEFIEVWYNRERRHSSLDYRTPVEHEEHLVTDALRVRRAA